MKLKVHLLDFELGGHEVFLNAKDAERYGLVPLDRIVLSSGDGHASHSAVVKVAAASVPVGSAGLPRDFAERARVKEHEEVTVLPATRPASVDYIRKKLDGKTLKGEEIRAIIEDISRGNLTDVEIAAYACATYTYDMNTDEIVACIEAMVDSGDKIAFERGPVLDVHSIGGVPGNKYAPITVSIVAANGLMIPKTSSRAISSACGTADFMEVVCPVEFSAQDVQRITEKVGATLCWGGGVNLAPADDAIIRVEYPLSIDPRAQLIASVMAKKKAVGAQFVVIEMPTGEGAKVESEEKARALARDFITVGEKIGMRVQCAITYGGQPIGRAIGPVLEIREALQVLEGSENPTSLVEKAASLAGILLELGGAAAKGEGYTLARETLRSGRALAKFREIVAAQGGDGNISSSQLTPGPFSHDVKSVQHGYVESIANKKLNRIARAAGAPRDKGAGMFLHLKKGRRVEVGEALYTIYAEHEHKLKEAVALANKLKPFQIEGMVIEEVVE